MCMGGILFSSILGPHVWKDFIIANVNVFSKQTTHQVNAKQNFPVIWATEEPF